MSAFRISTRAGYKLIPASLPRIARPYSSAAPSFEHITVSTPKPGVGLITLNRPKALNALFTPLGLELGDALRRFEKDDSIGATVITGSDKAFAAGADIKEMKDKSFADAYGRDFIQMWTDTVVHATKKPLIAAVNGYALGGGCELAMMADILYCSQGARFGQPEIKLGVLPGMGGSQRLTRAIGKAKAMELVLTGDNFTGAQAEQWGLAAKVFDSPQECVDGAIATAAKIASYSRIAVKAAKEAVNKSQELGLRDGYDHERTLFHGLFGSKDQKIGMTAFANKEKPQWSHE
ncbi:ClpP/crotonase-like domain-containing protein [Phyllosticta citriasiana]|uniref:ClpP/crotonase-like domain-containing protein n=1 Tax=Phyllosticta citriasiana TaxID=595635 RepID=A0ABR1KQP5_9PEZI